MPSLLGHTVGAALVALALTLGSVVGAQQGAAPGVVDVNTATAAELEQLPGIGEAKARAIVAAREKRGGFERVEELLEVRGIGPAALERLRPYVRVQGGAAPAPR